MLFYDTMCEKSIVNYSRLCVYSNIPSVLSISLIFFQFKPGCCDTSSVHHDIIHHMFTRFVCQVEKSIFSIPYYAINLQYTCTTQQANQCYQLCFQAILNGNEKDTTGIILLNMSVYSSNVCYYYYVLKINYMQIVFRYKFNGV